MYHKIHLFAANASLWSKIEQFGTEKMNKELELLKKRNEALATECVEAYKPVKQLSPEFQDYEPPGVRIEGKILDHNKLH